MAVAHKSVISIWALYIPVELYKTTRDISIPFNQLCKDTHERVRYKKYCPSCNKEVTNEDIIKGYEYEKNKYITFTEDELNKLKTQKDRMISVDHFAKMSQIDSIYFDKNYYLIPEPGATKAYELMRLGLLSKKKVGIAKVVLGTKEELVVLYPTKECIIAKVLYYKEEIQEIPKSIGKIEIPKEELEMTKVLIDTMTRDFDIAAYHDEYQQKIREAITTKINGNEIVSTDTVQPNNIIQYAEAIQKSIEMAKKQEKNEIGTA